MAKLANFNLKLAVFYSVMTGIVIVLFNLVTAYGETSLKAPINLSGNYLLDSPDLPDCLKSKKLNLTIEQSGIYLAGELSLIPPISPGSQSLDSQKENQTQAASATKKLYQTIKFNGLMGSQNTDMRSQPFVLIGQTSHLGDCSNERNLPQEIQLRSQFQNKGLKGQLQWSSLNLNITGKPKNSSITKEH